MSKPIFDAERIIAWLGAYVEAEAEADRTGKTVRVKGYKYSVSPRKDRKKDVE